MSGKLRDELIYGIHPIRQFLQTHPEDIVEIFLNETREDKRFQEIIQLAKEQGISLNKIQQKQLDQWLPETNHQGIAAKIRLKTPLTERDFPNLLENAKKPPLFLVLDGVQDPHNLGASLRTADAVSVTAVIIPRDRSASITPVVRKVACGAAETLAIVQVSNLVRALESLKELGVWIMGASGEAKQSLYQTDLKGPVAIVLGAEGTGLRRLTEECCDTLMHIPMRGTVESLNVSVAAGICLYEALRQRIPSPSGRGLG